ncbi:MAG TPA: alpha-L-fucosidase [Vicinamibacterales bacterium]|jgi:alpha-L-fucosidase
MTLVSRRGFVRTAAVAAAGAAARLPLAAQPQRPRPTAAQLAWQRDELAMFLHFGVNTFTDREWGDGKEDPIIFAPQHLDARQWARVARAAGFRALILTAKHHDGFCLWPTRTTTHSVASSPWRGGRGDVVREFVDACRAEGLRPGLYLSPWDRNNPSYGDSARYNDLYRDQLAELLTGYGTLAEVWFDGANGEGPNGKKQAYDWPRVWTLVRRLQPAAVIFSDAGPDVRWCGNEKGVAGDPNWSTVDPAIVTYPGASGPGVIDALQHGDPDGSVWRPPEADTSIRPGWFYHQADDPRVKTPDQLLDLYLSSVGRNSKLLLNVPPTRDGLLHDIDVARLTEFHQRRQSLFATELIGAKRIAWSAPGGVQTGEIDLGRTAAASVVRLEEDIAHGQAVARYSVFGSDGSDWKPLSSGTTIGHARIDRFPTASIRRVRLVIDEAIGPATGLAIKLYESARP